MYTNHAEYLRRMAVGPLVDQETMEHNLALLRGQLDRAEANRNRPLDVIVADVASRRSALETYQTDYDRTFPPVDTTR